MKRPEGTERRERGTVPLVAAPSRGRRLLSLPRRLLRERWHHAVGAGALAGAVISAARIHDPALALGSTMLAALMLSIHILTKEAEDWQPAARGMYPGGLIVRDRPESASPAGRPGRSARTTPVRLTSATSAVLGWDGTGTITFDDGRGLRAAWPVDRLGVDPGVVPGRFVGLWTRGPGGVVASPRLAGGSNGWAAEMAIIKDLDLRRVCGLLLLDIRGQALAMLPVAGFTEAGVRSVTEAAGLRVRDYEFKAVGDRDHDPDYLLYFPIAGSVRSIAPEDGVHLADWVS